MNVKENCCTAESGVLASGVVVDFSKQAEMDMARIVRTKAELERAKTDGVDRIVVKGELADKLKKTKKVAKLSGATLAVLVAAGAAVPFTGGVSFLVAAPAAALTGLEIAAIVAALTLGVALILAVYKDYEEIEYQDGHLVLRRKQRSAESEKQEGSNDV